MQAALSGKRLILFLGLTVLCLQCLPLPAQEPDWAANAWQSTRWSVGCDAYELAEMGADACSRVGENRDGLIVALEYELGRASTWLRDLGFYAPAADQAQVEGALPGDFRYNATIAADPEHFERDRCGGYTGGRQLLVRWDCLFVAAGRLPDDPSASRPRVVDAVIDRLMQTLGMFTATHELFHAVQRNYQSMETTFSKDHRWITEGMADAVELAYMMKFEPEIVSNFRNPGRVAAEIDGIAEENLDPAVTSAFSEFRSPRWYDKPLHEPEKHEDDRLSAYKTHEFWLFTGRFLNSTDSIQYLHDVLLADLSAEKGLPGVAAALSQLHEGGLYDLFPEFIKAVAKDGVYFETVTDVELRGQRPARVEQTLDAEGVEPVAANAYRIRVNIPADEEMGLVIKVEDHPEIHLIVDEERYDRSLTGTTRNEFRTSVSGNAEFFVRVANVSQDAATSELTYFNLTAMLIDEYAYMESGSGGGGALGPVSFDTPLPIEFDRFQRRHWIANNSPEHLQLGHQDVCTLQFEFDNTATRDTIAIRMDHEGPIAPGEYPVFNPGTSGLDFRYMQANPGIAMIGWGLGRGNALTGGYSFGYVGKSGTLTLASVSKDLVVGRVVATGERINCLDPDGKPSVIGNWFECPGPASLAVQSVFSVRPTGAGSNRPPSPSCFERDEQRLPPQGGGGSSENPGVAPPAPAVPSADEEPQAVSGTGTGDELPEGNEWLRLEVSGAIETTLLLQPPETMTSGGCDGSSIISIGYVTGSMADESLIHFSIETADVVGVGETGTYTLRTVNLDYGFQSPAHLPESAGIRTPVRYAGQGQLLLSEHNARVTDRTLGGTVTANLETRDGRQVTVNAVFRFPMSCGIGAF